LREKKDYFLSAININVGDEMAYSINQQTSLFLKQRGLTIADLERHPHIDDVILLANIRINLWDEFNRKEREYINAIWGIVYKQHHGIIPKHLDKITNIIQNIQLRRYKIKQLRATKATKRDDDYRGKTSLTR
jgi:hypothetical protein